MNNKEILQFLAKQKNDYFKKFGVTKLGLFGSAARGENPSDIDLIVEFEQGTEDLFEKKNKIREAVESRFHCMWIFAVKNL
jgi:predicted nucleotidyltransferase